VLLFSFFYLLTHDDGCSPSSPFSLLYFHLFVHHHHMIYMYDIYD